MTVSVVNPGLLRGFYVAGLIGAALSAVVFFRASVKREAFAAAASAVVIASALFSYSGQVRRVDILTAAACGVAGVMAALASVFQSRRKK